ncbi:hypothetical protein A8709_31110 [Paenibacillus pectinilyticus]|uniref:MI domain-containing protein n=1 Tax=Paenibacillus pectinilyticus TaxID=512399 RepID=A0A1C0ZW09_9BACL|nr:hypothetical protein [Paenibacillus pectinilyticus]OCT12285.1 hypothetical protein A8709_31110 [Paenibacillus pectinilyticus]
MTTELELARAKDIFTQYQGNTIQMHRAGLLETYKAFEISKETEHQWAKELIDRYISELSIRDWEAFSRLASLARDFKDIRILTNVVSFVSKHIMSSDSLVKLMVAESMIEMLTCLKTAITQDILYESLQITKRILDDIMSKPLILDPGHELAAFNLRDKKSLNLRANRSVEALRGLLS